MFKLPPKPHQVNRSPTRKSKSRRLARHRQLAIVLGSIVVIAVPSLLFGYFVKLKFDRLTKPATIPGFTNPQSSPSTSSQVTTTANSPPITNIKLAQFTANNSPELQRIVEEVKKHCQSKKLPIDSLSISLLNLKTGKHNGYRNTIYQYPASVVKLFWLFSAYNNYSDRVKDPDVEKAIQGMIVKSDNLSASQVLDLITNTKSTDSDLPPTDFQSEREKRQQLNKFYRDRVYSPSINVSQKTFPIPQQNIMEPKGFDRQLRGEDIQNPTRNKITTDDATLLMAEIMQHPRSEMKTLLTRDVDPKYWQKQPLNPIDFNPVHSFFGEDLEALGAEDIVSKAGWTSVSRQEVAYIRSKDGKTEYILTVFGDSKGYAEDKKLFPEISKIVYREMQKLSK
jgi:hypothetical protein